MTDLWKTFHQVAAGYTFYSSAHGTFASTDHMIGQKHVLRNLKPLKKIEIKPNIFLTTI